MSMNISGAGGGAMPHAVSGASGSMPPQKKMANLFDMIDSSGSGSGTDTITKAQFDNAFKTMKTPAAFKAAGASAVWKALDPKGTGQVSRQDFIASMKDLMVELRKDNGGSPASTAAAGTQALRNLR